MVPPRPHPARGEAQPVGEGNDDRERLEEPLGVPVPARDRLGLAAQLEASPGPQEPLALVDPPRLLLGLVHLQLEAARRVLVVHRARRRRLDEGGAGLDREDLRPHVPRLRVLDRRRRDELLPALQHADRVVGLHRAVTLLDDHELAVQEAGLGVVEALRRESREEHDVFGWAEPLDHLGEPALPRPALARARSPRAGPRACARRPPGRGGACSSPRPRSRERRCPSRPGRGDPRASGRRALPRARSRSSRAARPRPRASTPRPSSRPPRAGPGAPPRPRLLRTPSALPARLANSDRLLDA